MTSLWYQLSNPAAVSSPALLLYLDRVRKNIRGMIATAGGVDRLRPHMKTHKMAEVIRLQMEQGITKFKCATIAEAEMVARCGAPDVLLAYQPVGPNVDRLFQLIRAFPKTEFAVVADDIDSIRALSTASQGAHEAGAISPRAGAGPEGAKLEVLLDLDVGQHRTGVEPGPK